MERCALCPGVNNVVPDCGSERCSVMLVGEAPGKDENKHGIPFVGKTGTELSEQYLPLADLDRSQLRVTNAVKCLPPGNGKLDPTDLKDAALIKCCAETHLYN